MRMLMLQAITVSTLRVRVHVHLPVHAQVLQGAVHVRVVLLQEQAVHNLLQDDKIWIIKIKKATLTLRVWF